MDNHSVVPASVMGIIRERLGDRLDEFLVPPPVFVTMHGEFLAFDLEGEWLTARFPVPAEYLNPYGSMQGGMVAAAVDNTLGPLSMLVAPPNVTRRLQMKYSRPVTPDLKFIIVEARLTERKDRWLSFRAEVKDEEGTLLARARAVHWIVDENVG
jgi:uncharacterized protein (TIGR00369 family)